MHELQALKQNAGGMDDMVSEDFSEPKQNVQFRFIIREKKVLETFIIKPNYINVHIKSPFVIFASQGEEELLKKLKAHDRLMMENVDLRTQVKAAQLDVDKSAAEVEKVNHRMNNVLYHYKYQKLWFLFP